MKLADYRTEFESIRDGRTEGTPEALLIALETMGRDLRQTRWNTGFREEAAELAGEVEQLTATLQQQHRTDDYHRTVGTVAEHTA